MGIEGIGRRLIQEVESRAGFTLVSEEKLAVMEGFERDLRLVSRDLEDLGYTVLNMQGGRPSEMNSRSRKTMAQLARKAYLTDPMAGAAVDKLNHFTFGRGVPLPRAKDQAVQEIIDEAWNDPDNQRVLTGFQAQIEQGTDLTIQCNVFLLIFDEGDDAKVKLGLLSHDTVQEAVTDPDNRLRVLYYFTVQSKQHWDFKSDTIKLEGVERQQKKMYFEHWQNVEEATEEEGREEPLEKPPEEKLGEGRVYHIAINKGMEAVFGSPEFQRTLRWFNAYNEMMVSRVDMVKAAAAFAMKRTIKGTPNQVTKMAAKALSRRSDLASSERGYETGQVAPPASGSILNENDMVSHEPFKIDSGAAQASQDALSLRAQVSAGTGFPQHYLGDAGSANLATATSMELPVLKMVEARQEVWEQVFRWFVDRVIERAVDAGKLTEHVEGEELEESLVKQGWRWFEDEDGARRLCEARVIHGKDGTVRFEPKGNRWLSEGAKQIRESHEDKADDEVETERDLSYDFSMPSALKRMMTDLVTSIATTARTFDPNNTNMELSRALLLILLSEAFEVQDAAEMVDRIFPEGYVDPAIAAAQQQAAGMDPNADPNAAGPGNFFGPDGDQHSATNPYGAPMKATPPERVTEALLGRGRDASFGWGGEVLGRPEPLDELAALFAADVSEITAERLGRLVVGANGANPGGAELDRSSP